MKPLVSNLTEDIIKTLPVHDAEMISLLVTQSSDGNQKCKMELTLHPDEPLASLLDIGIDGNTVVIIFENCWQMIFNLLGHTSSSKILLQWQTLSESPLSNAFIQKGFFRASHTLQHTFMFSDGSVLDILAETCSAQGKGNVDGQHP